MLVSHVRPEQGARLLMQDRLLPSATSASAASTGGSASNAGSANTTPGPTAAAAPGPAGRWLVFACDCAADLTAAAAAVAAVAAARRAATSLYDIPDRLAELLRAAAGGGDGGGMQESPVGATAVLLHGLRAPVTCLS